QVAVIQSHFYDIRSDIISSVAVGRIKISDQLKDMQQTVEACQRDVESRIDALRKSNVDEWHDLKAPVEDSIDAYRRTVTALASAATAKRD
ncbi:MAG: hypothetical protein KJO82_09995, partial [Gammaproteobacteria bacterium]|nr:hypothetical protein [Gammaproteobacteria bacterium]